MNSSFKKIRNDLGPVQVLVYNAGARRVNGRSILDTTTEEFENFTKINLFGAFWSTKCVLPDMLAAGKGTILFTGATGALRGMPGLASFSPGKFGCGHYVRLLLASISPTVFTRHTSLWTAP